MPVLHDVHAVTEAATMSDYFLYHRPMTQVLALAKVLIDALNESEFEKYIKGISPKDSRGIVKFSIFLEENGYKGIDLLKLVQGLRSAGIAHLKGGNYEKLAVKLGLAQKELRPFFSELLDRATNFIELLISRTKKPTCNEAG